ncbi:MAG: TetR/AcrR family transcriptional regulator [Microbacterium sp.]
MTSTTGRPRASGESLTGRGTREDILAASAALFCNEGYGSTSTHAIAQAAGIRQASLYHHFAGKHEILLDLLLSTVQPSLDAATEILSRHEPAATRLWALADMDADLLLGGELNLGALYLLPELYDPRFAVFHERRAQLDSAYERLVAACDVPDAEAATWLVLALVESVIVRRRRSPAAVTPADAPAVATAALRLLELDRAQIEAAAAAGPALVATLTAP